MITARLKKETIKPNETPNTKGLGRNKKLTYLGVLTVIKLGDFTLVAIRIRSDICLVHHNVGEA